MFNVELQLLIPAVLILVYSFVTFHHELSVFLVLLLFKVRRLLWFRIRGIAVFCLRAWLFIQPKASIEVLVMRLELISRLTHIY